MLQCSDPLACASAKHTVKSADALRRPAALDVSSLNFGGAQTPPSFCLVVPSRSNAVRRRLEGICATAGVSLAKLDVQVITAPSLRLDLEADRARLDEIIARLTSRLLVLDPFVRLHRIDENVSGDVAPSACLPARTAASPGHRRCACPPRQKRSRSGQSGACVEIPAARIRRGENS